MRCALKLERLWGIERYSSSTEIAKSLASGSVLSFSSRINLTIIIIGAPIIAPAIPHTWADNITVSRSMIGEIPNLAPERLGSIRVQNIC